MRKVLAILLFGIATVLGIATLGTMAKYVLAMLAMSGVNSSSTDWGVIVVQAFSALAFGGVLATTSLRAGKRLWRSEAALPKPSQRSPPGGW